MAGPGRILKEIHRLSKHIKDLSDKIKQGPLALKGHQLAQSRAEETLKTSQDAVKHLKVSIHEKETGIKASQAQILKLEKTDISSKKEYDALQAEIASSKANIRTLEDEILEAMSAIDEKAKEVTQFEKALEKAKSNRTQFESDHQERLNLFADERKKSQAQLKQIEGTLDDITATLYHRQVEGRGEDALSGVEGRICSACYTEVTLQMVNDLSRDVVHQCKSCGRILYKV